MEVQKQNRFESDLEQKMRKFSLRLCMQRQAVLSALKLLNSRIFDSHANSLQTLSSPLAFPWQILLSAQMHGLC